MPEPLSLFIHAPFQPAGIGGGAGGPWTRRLGYGDALPAPLRGSLGDVAEFAWLGTSDPSAAVHAAAAGYLSSRFPVDRIAEPDGALPPLAPTAHEPDSLLLYLNPRPFLDLFPGFAARAAGLRSDMPTASTAAGDRFRVPPGFVTCFIYMSIDTASVRAALATRLDELTVPPAATAIERDRRWRLFLAGDLDVYVDAGEVIGSAGATTLVRSSAGGAPADAAQVGFAVLSEHGTIDPGRFYDHYRDFVLEEPTIDDFLALIPPQWPVLDPALPLAEAMARVGQFIYPFSALTEFARDRALTSTQWRDVGDLQKALYRQRLLQLVGHAPALSAAPPFEFNDHDWRNVFQLEAVCELYANFRDPRRGGEVPLAPTEPSFRTVDLLAMEGTAAVPAGAHLTFVNPPDLEQIWPGEDLIMLDEDTARPGRTYRITDVDIAGGVVTLDGAPNIGVAGSTGWRIQCRPLLVLIDAFGPRLAGNAATVTATSPEIHVRLDAPVAEVAKINKHGFDTIFFHDDTAAHRPPRTYGVVDVVAGTSTIVLADRPTLPAAGSAWRLSAGVAGQLPAMAYNLMVNVAQGTDHYDGLMVVVYDGQIRSRHRFSSYTSHNYPVGPPPNQSRSSLRGNDRYFLTGYRSGDAYKNFSLKVVDRGSMTFTPAGWAFGYDGVRENRFYFEEIVTEDSTVGVPIGGGAGKTEIRIHRGNLGGAGTGSAGCIVSPAYFELRRELVDIARTEHNALTPGLAFPAGLNQIGAALTAAANTAAYNALGAAVWNDRLRAQLWVIRPSERPIG